MGSLGSRIKRIIKTFVVILFSILLILQVSFYFFSKQILWNFISKKVEQKTSGKYSLSIDKFRISVLTGSVFVTNFSLIPNFENIDDISKITNFYKFSCDTFKISLFNYWALIPNNKSIIIQKILIAKPSFTIYSAEMFNQKVTFTEKKVNYKELEQNVFDKLLMKFEFILIRKLIVNEGFISFLANNNQANSFSTEKISIKIDKLLTNRKIFNNEVTKFRFKSIEFVLYNYVLNLNDSIHQLKAQYLKLNTQQNLISIYNFQISPKENSKKQKNSLDFKIIHANLVYDDFNKIVTSNVFHLKKAEFIDIVSKIRTFKKEKKLVNKDSLEAKLNFHNLFKNFYDSLLVDSLFFVNADFWLFKQQSSIAHLLIKDMNFNAYNFLIDKNSFYDTSRFLYAKNFDAKISEIDFQPQNKQIKLHITNLHAISSNKSFNFQKITFNSYQNNKITAEIDSISFENFNYIDFFYSNNLILDKIIAKKLNVKIQLKETSKKQTSASLNNFINKVYINRILLKNGKLEISKSDKNKNFVFKSNFKIKTQNIIVDPQAPKITKKADINQIDIIFTKIIFFAKDSIYSITADTLWYSTNSKDIVLSNFILKPFENNDDNVLKIKHISSLISLKIPYLRLTRSNLNKAILLDSLNFRSLMLSDASLNFTFYPFAKIENENKYFSDSILSLNTIYTTQLYDKYKYFDYVTLEDFINRKFLIDTITKISIFYAKKIKNKQLNVLTQSVEKIFMDFCNTEKPLQNSEIILTSFNSYADSLFEISLNKFSFNDIFKITSNFFPRIIADSLFARNFKINVLERNLDNSKLILSTNADFSFLNFNFDKDSIANNNKILFSSAFYFAFKNTIFSIPKSSFFVECENIAVNSKNKSIFAGNISVFQRDSTELIFKTFDIQRIYVKQIDFSKLYTNQYFYADTLKIINSDVDLEINSKIKTFDTVKVKKPVKQPENIFFSKIIIENTNINLNINKKITVSTIADFYLDKIKFDTLQEKKIPFDTFKSNFLDVRIKLPNNSEIKATKLVLNSTDSSIKIKNIAIDINDSLQNKIVSLLSNSFQIVNIQLLKYFRQKQIIFDSLLLESSVLKINSKKDTLKTKKEQKDLDLFSKISSIANSLQGNTIQLKSFQFLNSKNDTLKLTSLKLNKLKIDSTTTMFNPNMFYCQNIIFEIPQHTFYIADSSYFVSFQRIKGSTAYQILEIDGLNYAPTVEFNQFQEKFKAKYPFRTSPTSIYCNMILSLDFDYKEFVQNRTIRTRLVNIDSVMLISYMDKNYKHNENQRKTNLAQKMLNVPLNLDIQLINIRNFNAKYSEVAPITNKIAYVTVDNSDLKIVNLINDTNKISEFNKYFYIENTGKVNKIANFNIKVFYDLKSKGTRSRIYGSFDPFDISTFNTYTVYSANISFDKGFVNKLYFDFDVYDTISYGKLLMEYSNLRTSLMEIDTTLLKRRKFLSWIINNFVIRTNNPQMGLVPNQGVIAYIHNPSYSEFKLWGRSILSGVQSTVVFKPKDYRKVKKFFRKEIEKQQDTQ